MAIILQALTDHRNNPLLAILGFTSHCIVPDDPSREQSRTIMAIDHFEGVLEDGLKNGLTTTEEADDLRKQVVLARLPADSRAIIQRIRDAQVEGKLDNLSFRMCGDIACTGLLTLGHGEIFVGDDRVEADRIGSVEALLYVLHDLVAEDEPVCTPHQAVLLLRQVLQGSKLPLDCVEYCARYDALSEVDRQRYEESCHHHKVQDGLKVLRELDGFIESDEE